jgi:hypothetical protein
MPRFSLVELLRAPIRAWKWIATSGIINIVDRSSSKMGWGVLVVFIVGILGIIRYASYFNIKPYNGDVMAARIPDQCAPVVSKYLGGRAGENGHKEQYTISIDQYGKMENALTKCIAEARIDVHQRGNSR